MTRKEHDILAEYCYLIIVAKQFCSTQSNFCNLRYFCIRWSLDFAAPLSSRWKRHVSRNALIIISGRISWWMTSASRTSRKGTSDRRIFAGGTFSVIASRGRRKHVIHLASEVDEAKGVKTQVGLLMMTRSSILLKSNLYQRPPRQSFQATATECKIDCRLLLPMLGHYS